MAPPFSADEFFHVFVAYNSAVWPAQILLVGLALAAMALAFRPGPGSGRAIAAILAILWVWMAIAYHWAFFSEINPAARFFGGLFLLEGAVLTWAGFRSVGVRFEPRRDRLGVTGAFFILFALALYPVLGLALGHRYPAQPTFGLPCPTTIFTVGLLLWARPPVSWILLVVPVVWSMVGMTAVIYFGVFEDALLPVATLSAASLIALENRPWHRQQIRP